MTRINPVLAGWHPDPSVCRAGEWFYLVTSTFAFHPGLPVMRSRDLESWETVSHALSGESWMPLEVTDINDGVWAPTIRHHDGTFYLVFGVAHARRGAGFFLTTASSAHGPWTPPAPLEGDGIDPSLFFDVDGRCWLTAARDSVTPGAQGPGEIWMRELDLDAPALVGPTHVLWHGAVAGAWVEGPHLYRHGDTYVLLGAEGGTERNHAVTAATASSVTGPYRTDPRSPLLTHRHLGESEPVQNVGHADLVEGPDGRWWAVVLGTRPVDGHHVRGRETFVVPVEWDDAGPVLAPGVGRVTGEPASATPAPDWISPYGPVDATVDGATVTLGSRPGDPDRPGPGALLGLRQSSLEFTLRATVDAAALGERAAGLAAYQNDDHLLSVTLRRSPHGAIALAEHRADGRTRVLGEAPVSGRVTLALVSGDGTYRAVARDDAGETELASIPHAALSTETAGGFVGVTLGLLHAGPRGSAPVVFEGVRDEA